MGLRRFLLHSFFLLKRPMTLGVRAIVLNKDNEILLVRHTYVPGWHLPGGGVETHETVEQALVKELKEEAGIVLKAPPKLLGLYKNKHASKRDHVVLFLCRDFKKTGSHKPDFEIAEIGFFSLGQLPSATVPSVLHRLDEVLNGKKISQYW